MKTLKILLTFLGLYFAGLSSTFAQISTISVEDSISSNIRTIASQTIKKNARKNDIADSYELDKNGNFYRYIGKRKCQITNNVDSFKVSQHPEDEAVVYFVKDRDLYVLHNASFSGNCPKTSKKNILHNVKKYSIVPSAKTNVVNVALDNNGILVAWGNSSRLYRIYGIENYHINNCFGSGKSFSSYLLFASNMFFNIVYKIKSNGDNKAHPGFYESISDFKESVGVCQ